MSLKASSIPRSNHSLRTGSGHLLRASAAQNILSKAATSGMGGAQKPNPDHKHTAVVSYDELQRIKQQCSLGNQLEAEERNRERAQLQEMSRARVKNWPNTIDALRKKKEEDRIKRLEQEEIERRKVDAVENDILVEARRNALDRANKALHQSQDQVKAFHSKMLMCDTIQEREVQQQIRKRKLEIEKTIDKQWEEMEKQKMDEYDENVRQKLMAEFQKKIETSKIIKDQLLEFKMRFIKRYQEEQLEGQLIKRQAEEAMMQERQKELERREHMEQQKKSFKQANEELVKQTQLDRLKELEEEKKIDIYAQKKEAMEKLRKDKEEQKFQEKQMTRQKLVDRQIEHLKNLKNREDEILNKQVAEAEHKANMLFEEQERRRYEMKLAIDKSRQHQLDKKQREKEILAQEQKEFTEFWKIRNQELEIARQQEEEEELMRNKEVKGYLKKQMEVKQRKVEDEFKRELQEQTKAQALLDQQEKTFYSYAEQCVKQWQDNGKNVKPLILELKGYKKRLVS